MTTLQEIRDRLDKLAVLESADAVAWELEAQGVTGVRSKNSACAIARYLGNTDALSLDDRVLVGAGHAAPWPANDVVPLPQVVKEFVKGFDLGAYPALIDPNYPDPLIGQNQ
jgi:hypothetical protein